jgi:hypothetical protein
MMVTGRWAEHHQEAMIAFGEFADIERRVLESPVDSDGTMRSFHDPEFISEVYRTGTRAVLSAILALQHLTAEIEILTKATLGSLDLLQRVATTARKIGFESHTAIDGWDAIPELVELRHAIEHPTVGTLFSQENWDKVPTAWMFSDRPTKAGDRFLQFFDKFASRWMEYLEALPKETVTYNIQRGMGSDLSVKKPPPDSG